MHGICIKFDRIFNMVYLQVNISFKPSVMLQSSEVFARSCRAQALYWKVLQPFLLTNKTYPPKRTHASEHWILKVIFIEDSAHHQHD